MPFQPNDPVFGRNLNPADFIFDENSNLIGIRVDSANLGRNDAGDITVTGLPEPVIQAILDRVPASEGGNVNVNAGGFDPESEVLTLNLTDGAQVPVGMDGVVTKNYLAEAGRRELVDVFGQPTGIFVLV